MIIEKQDYEGRIALEELKERISLLNKQTMYALIPRWITVQTVFEGQWVKLF